MKGLIEMQFRLLTMDGMGSLGEGNRETFLDIISNAVCNSFNANFPWLKATL